MLRLSWMVLALLAQAHLARAATRYVSPAGSDGPGCLDPAMPCRSVMHAIEEAGSDDTIRLAPGRYEEQIALDGSDPPRLRIEGDDPATTWIDGGLDIALAGCDADELPPGGAPVVIVGETHFLHLVRVTITGGTARGGAYAAGAGVHNSGTILMEQCIVEGNFASPMADGPGPLPLDGAAFRNDYAATATINESTLSGNIGRGGGAISNSGTLTLNNCTLSGNSVTGGVGLGAGLFNRSGTAVLDSCTVADNADCGFHAPLGVGIVNESGSVTLRNSIVWGNRSMDLPRDCQGSITLEGANLIGDVSGCDLAGDLAELLVGDPLLGRLADNGGPTPTHALAGASPAVDRVDSGCSFSTDQRGFPRPADGDCDSLARCDLGAFELDGCGGPDISIYEHGDPTALGTPAAFIGTTRSSPARIVPAPAALLFYSLDDGLGRPAVIRVVGNGSELRAFY